MPSSIGQYFTTISEKKYWNSLDQLNNEPAFVAESQKEFQDEIPVEEFLGKESLVDTSASRRDFLKFMGFSLGAATLAACETPVVKSIPYVVKPEEVTPGVANWYASTFNVGGDFARKQARELVLAWINNFTRWSVLEWRADILDDLVRGVAPKVTFDTTMIHSVWDGTDADHNYNQQS